jgi:hypothetical protein
MFVFILIMSIDVKVFYLVTCGSQIPSVWLELVYYFIFFWPSSSYKE